MSGASLKWWCLSFADEDAFKGGCFDLVSRGFSPRVRLASDRAVVGGAMARKRPRALAHEDLLAPEKSLKVPNPLTALGLTRAAAP